MRGGREDTSSFIGRLDSSVNLRSRVWPGMRLSTSVMPVSCY